MELIRCWDYMKCEAARVSTCSAALQRAGRYCWLVAGTLNGGKTECDHALKLKSCKECTFYQLVKTGDA